MNTELVDFHCHLDLYPDFPFIIDECEINKIHTLAITTTPKAWVRNFELTKSKEYVRCALGFHPQLVFQRSHEITLWKEYLPSCRYIGEVGLDAGPNYYKSFELQKKIFENILIECNIHSDKIFSIHSIRSSSIVLDMIEKHASYKKNKFVLHWFTGNISDVSRAARLGCFFSINNEMLNSSNGKNVIKAIPIERLLTESDGPFTYNGRERFRPKDITITLTSLALLLSLNLDELKSKIISNLNVLES